MTTEQILTATAVWLVLLVVAYGHSGYVKIRDCYLMLWKKEYWTDFNTVEFFSYVAKVIIIIPGLIWGLQVWWLYFLTLGTSLTLIWASNKKLLPTLLGFNTVWAWISCMVLAQHLLK